MPYIEKSRREAIKNKTITPSTAGDLNYLVTMLCQEYLEVKGESYQTYNDIMGALTGAQLELYRRKTAIYEDKKIFSNGDVWL